MDETLPNVIETDQEFDRCVEMRQALDRRYAKLTKEEKARLALLDKLIRDYDDHVELPE